MATLDVTTIGGGKAGSVELAPEVFEAAVKPHLFHAEVRRQLSRRRAGTHATRNRSAVSGGGAKPYRQKGTGRARQGTIRAPQFAGGGTVFGPVPRGYEHKLTKKTRRAALRSALSLRQQEGAVTVVDAFETGEYKTRKVAEALGSLGLAETSVLIVIPEADPFLERSAANLRGVGVLRAAGLNVHDVLRHEKLVIVQGALDAIHARFSGGASA
ncbi:MAG: 50S ribosomal protein L4 [Deltaproteobacteria bacterium]|jgi:large subunit ribosomal protein L4|nr:50S ribosomal protein L4 [Deltaproteobacteria bacterium]